MSKLSDINTIKAVLSKYGFEFSKSLGQNFLINPSICPKMAEECNIDKNSGVLEVGPGIGVLTYELGLRAKKVVSVELDKRLIPVLSDTLSEFDNIKIINNDILKLDLKELLLNEFNGMPISVCANLPYYITSPVIMRFLEERLPINSITVMVQKEAADRICAPIGTRESGAISLAIRYFSEPEILFKVSKGSFMPSPKVDSAVIRLNILKKPSVDVKNEKLFFSIVKFAFAQRRKTISNSISAGLKMPKDEFTKILEKLNISPMLRAEQLSLEQFAKISDELST